MRRYHVTTFGCQMNAHDSERIKGMLEELGLGEALSQDEADVIVFNTCTIREKPDQRFAAHLAQARALKERDPERVIAVGGCYAEAQRERLFDLYPFVDVAFGPGSIAHLGDWLGAGGLGVERGRFGTGEERHFAGALPTRRERRVPGVGAGLDGVQLALRVLHRARGARPGASAAGRARSSPRSSGLAGEGVREVTLLGQNVNSWGRDLAPAIQHGVRRAAPRGATRSTASSGSASRARTRRTSASR